jgi:hypothetical protein
MGTNRTWSRLSSLLNKIVDMNTSNQYEMISVIDDKPLPKLTAILPSMFPPGTMVSKPTPHGGITQNPSSGIVVELNQPFSSDILSLFSLQKVAVPLLSAVGMNNQSVVDVACYADPSSIYARAIDPSREVYQYSIANQLMSIDPSTGVISGPGLAAGTTSVSLQNIDCFGYLITVNAQNILNGQNDILVSIVNSGGSVLKQFNLSLQNLNGDGVIYIARTGQGISTSSTMTLAGQAAYGPSFPNNQAISLAPVNALQTDVFKQIFQDADAPSTSQNYVVLLGLNAILCIIPVPITNFTKRAWFEHYFRGMLPDWGLWCITKFRNAASLAQYY